MKLKQAILTMFIYLQWKPSYINNVQLFAMQIKPFNNVHLLVIKTKPFNNVHLLAMKTTSYQHCSVSFNYYPVIPMMISYLQWKPSHINNVHLLAMQKSHPNIVYLLVMKTNPYQQCSFTINEIQVMQTMGIYLQWIPSHTSNVHLLAMKN